MATVRYLKVYLSTDETTDDQIKQAIDALPGASAEIVASHDLVRHGLNILERDYMADVDSVAEELAAEIRAGDLDRDSFLERLHETIDGHHNVIYTQAAQIVALVSRNDDAFIDSFGAEGLVRDDSINWPGIAFAAMERDVLETLDRMGLDVNDDDTFRAEDDDSEDDASDDGSED